MNAPRNDNSIGQRNSHSKVGVPISLDRNLPANPTNSLLRAPVPGLSLDEEQTEATFNEDIAMQLGTENQQALAHGFIVRDPSIFVLLVRQLPYWMCVSEAVRNSVEASKTVDGGLLDHPVTVDVMPLIGFRGKVIGTRIRDDAHGMTQKQMYDWLTEMGKGGKPIGERSNLGLGMKLVGGYKNEKTQIISWKNGRAHQVIIGRVDELGTRGVIPQEYGGKMFKVVPCDIPDGVNSRSGTQVDYTWDKGNYSQKAIVEFLNTRLLRVDLPGYREDSLIRVARRSDVNSRTRVVGLLESLFSECLTVEPEQKTLSCVEGKVANYHWGILKDTGRNRSDEEFKQFATKEGNIFYAWRDEVFVRGRQASLQTDWSIDYGADRFVLVVEFKDNRITPYPTRASINNFAKFRKLAMAEWKRLMPDEVSSYIEERQSNSNISEGDEKLGKKLLKELHPEPPATLTSLTERKRRTRNPGGNKGGKTGSAGGSKNSNNNSNKNTKDDEGIPSGTGREKKPIIVPWADVELSNDLGTEPASYKLDLPSEQHTLRINPDFPPVRDLLDRAARRGMDEATIVQELLKTELKLAVNDHIKTMGTAPDINNIYTMLVSGLQLTKLRCNDPKALNLSPDKKRSASRK